MSNKDDMSVNQVLETVTSTIRSMVGLVDTAVASIKNHNEAIDGLAKITQDQDARIRTLQSQVYALREDLTGVINGHNFHVDNPNAHVHTSPWNRNA
jgi:hypothetical protein